MKNNLSKITAFIALVLTFVGVIFSSLANPNQVVDIVTLMAGGIFYLLIGVAFMYAGNKTVERIGNGIIAIFAVAGLAAMFSSGIVLTSFDELINIFVVILLVISSVYYVIGLTLNHFGYSKFAFFTSANNNKSTNLRQWKKLVDNNLIDEADYDKVKNLVLGNDPKVKDVNELRDLIAQGLANKNDLDNVLK